MPIPQIEIRPVLTKKDLHRFVLLPWRIYAGERNWVPPLISDTKMMLTPGKHPFHEHAEVALFMAWSGGEPAGRIAAIVNHRHNEFHGEKTGFFGFFETIDDPAVSSVLLDTASRWVAERGMDRLRGPASFSTNEECALLIDGFDSPPVVMMPYNPPYYIGLLESAGFSKAKDLLAYYAHTSQMNLAHMEKFADRVLDREGATLRALEKKRTFEEVNRFRAVYNRAWDRNWGFVPMTDAEIDHMAHALKPVIEPGLVLFLEKKGETIGFALALPDLNFALKHANGRLFPFGMLKLLYYARKIPLARVLVLGLLREHRGRGLDIPMYLTLIRNAAKKGIHAGEFSWILEDNIGIQRPLERFGARVYKRYRFYERPIRTS